MSVQSGWSRLACVDMTVHLPKKITATDALNPIAQTVVILCRNGDAAEAMALAEFAAATARRVVLLHAGAGGVKADADTKVDVLRLAADPAWPRFLSPPPSRAAWCAYDQLRVLKPDVVIAYGALDLIYVALQARAAGCGFAQTRFVAMAVRPTLYAAELEAHPITGSEPLLVDHMERSAVALADVTVTENSAVAMWLADCGWASARLLPAPTRLAPAALRFKTGVVHVGPFEPGVTLRSLRRLAEFMAPARLTVIVSPEDADGASALSRVADLVVEPDAAAWLLSENRNGVLVLATGARTDRAMLRASCGECGALFLTPMHPGPHAATPEGVCDLVAEAAHARELDPAQLWAQLALLFTEARSERSDAAPVRISVCIVHHERPRFLIQALKGLVRQTKPPLEVVLVDDGSRSPAAERCLRRLGPIFAARGWTLIRQPNRYLGAARNAAARAARGEFLVFHDDDNVAAPGQLEAFARAVSTSGADVVTCLQSVFEGKRRPRGAPREVWAPIGGAPVAYSLVANGFGDANALVRRSVFNAAGGFSEDYGVGYEDWEFFARVALAGAAFVLVPEPLVWYRVGSGGMLRATPSHGRDHMRVLRPYLKAMPPTLRAVALLAQGLALGDDDDWRTNPAGAGSQAFLRELLRSRSWRWTAPVRALFRYPEIAAGPENAEVGKVAVIRAMSILSSPLWDLTAPLRLVERAVGVAVAKGRRRRDRSAPRAFASSKVQPW